MGTLSENLQYLMQRYGLNETSLARKTNVGQPVVHRLASGETDNPKVATLSPIARLFGLDISQLIGDLPLPKNLPTRIPETAPEIWRAIPLLTLSQAIQWPEVVPAKAAIGQAFTDLHLSAHAYAVRLTDDSMAPLFPQDSEIIIEPSIKPKDEDYALVALAGARQAQFRQYLLMGDAPYLNPLNPELETLPLETPHRVLGVMAQGRVNF